MITTALVHPISKASIQRHIEVLNQHLAISDSSQGLGVDSKVCLYWRPIGARRKNYAVIHGHQTLSTQLLILGRNGMAIFCAADTSRFSVTTTLGGALIGDRIEHRNRIFIYKTIVTVFIEEYPRTA
jgi:hypothetical protein